ncbi:MAG TPA: hypothetical protein VMF07_16750 [Solirubrobacteraceae bacterium]|nr:hypothetical protein [Solirubrobacteraceae bacterium]
MDGDANDRNVSEAAVFEVLRNASPTRSAHDEDALYETAELLGHGWRVDQVALEVAAAMMRAPSWTELATRLRDAGPGAHALADTLGEPEDEDTRAGVAAVLTVAFARLGERGLDMLTLAALVAPEPTPTAVFHAAEDRYYTPPRVNDDVDWELYGLNELALLRDDANAEVRRIDPVVAAAILQHRPAERIHEVREGLLDGLIALLHADADVQSATPKGCCHSRSASPRTPTPRLARGCWQSSPRSSTNATMTRARSPANAVSSRSPSDCSASPTPERSAPLSNWPARSGPPKVARRHERC